MPFGGLLTAGIISGGSSILGGLFGGSAAKKAAQQQSAAAQRGIDFSQSVFNSQQQTEQPFIQAGVQASGDLMTALGNHELGLGSLPAAPNAPGAFEAPTLEDARNSPGYQFAAQQGTKGILQAAAGAGGAISGGTLRAADMFNSGLADSTYGNVFNRALSGYGAGLQRYQAQLQQFGANMGAQQQGFEQMALPIAVGQTAAGQLGQVGQQASQTVSNLFTGQGNAQAAGTVGSHNAIWNGVNGAAGDLMSSILYGKLFPKKPGGIQNPGIGPAIDGMPSPG